MVVPVNYRKTRLNYLNIVIRFAEIYSTFIFNHFSGQRAHLDKLQQVQKAAIRGGTGFQPVTGGYTSGSGFLKANFPLTPAIFCLRAVHGCVHIFLAGSLNLTCARRTPIVGVVRWS